MDKSEDVAEKPLTITLSTKAKRRMRASREETEILEQYYAENTSPTNKKKVEIAEAVQMGVKNVQFWFQNRRARDNKRKKMVQMIKERRLLKGGSSTDICEQGFYEGSPFKESYDILCSQQQQLETLKRAKYENAANKLPPIPMHSDQKKSHQGGVGLDVSFYFHHSLYGIEASYEQWERSKKDRE